MQVGSTSFVVQSTINGSTFEIDKVNNISKVAWKGKVDLDTAKNLLTVGGDSVEFDGFTKLLIDRSLLTEFDTEARVWIKNLYKTRAKKLAHKVEKMAIVNANSKMGNIFSNMMTSAISLIVPNLKLKIFDTIDEAEKWLLV